LEYVNLKSQFSNVKSKSFQGKKFKDLSLYYDMFVVVQGCSFADMLAGPRCSHHEPTVEERVQELRKNARVYLVASTGNLRWDVPLKDLPKSIEDKYRGQYEKDEAERRRFEALSPEDKEAETTELLRQLAGPGFMAVNPTGMAARAAKTAGIRIIRTK
jgi:hypothetical protein